MTRADPFGSHKIRLIKQVAFLPGLDFNPHLNPSVITPTFLIQFSPHPQQ